MESASILCVIAVLMTGCAVDARNISAADWNQAGTVVANGAATFKLLASMLESDKPIDLKAVVKLVVSIADIAGQFHPIGKVIAQVLRAVTPGESSDYEKILVQFRLLHDRFDKVDAKLTNILNAVNEGQAFSLYNEKVLIPKKNLQTAAKAYANTKTNVSLIIYRKTCKDEKPNNILGALSEIVTGKLFGATFLEAIYSSSDMNRQQYSLQVARVLTDLSELSMFAASCATMIDPDTPEIFYENIKNDTQGVIEEITTLSDVLEQKLLKDWPDKALKEVSSLVQTKDKLNQTFATKAFEHLSKKYYWNYFVVDVVRTLRNRWWKKLAGESYDRWNADVCVAQATNSTGKCDVYKEGQGIVSGYRTIPLTEDVYTGLFAWTSKEAANAKKAELARRYMEKAFGQCSFGGHPSSADMVKMAGKSELLQQLDIKWMYVSEAKYKYLEITPDGPMYAGTHPCSYVHVAPGGTGPAGVATIHSEHEFIIGL